jgi:hypothetical protein
LSGGIGPETVMTRGAIGGPPFAPVGRSRAAGASGLGMESHHVATPTT